MTLTEQWKKGELKRGMYWVVVDADGDRSIQPCVYGSEFDDFEEVADEDLSFITAGNINQREHYSICWEEVLAPVPSYEEWQKLQKNLKSITDSYKVVAGRCTQLEKFLEEFNALDVAEENEAIKTKLSIQCEANEELRKENQQIKELLKDCRFILREMSDVNNWLEGDDCELNYDMATECGKYVTKITNAIGEKK